MEQLSAFTEHALDGGERRQVLAHLAVCGRCREVIALAQQAVAADEMAMEEVELEEAAIPAAAMAVALPAPAPALPAPTSRRPSPWWRGWRVALVPAAALAAAAGFAVWIHLAGVGRNGEVANNTAPALSQNETAEKPAPPEQAKELPPPAPAAPHASQKLREGLASIGAPQGLGGAAPEMAPPAPAVESLQVEADQSTSRSASAAESVELRGAAGSPAAYKAAAAPAPDQAQLQVEPTKQAADRDRQAEARKAQDHLDQLYAAGVTQASSGDSAKYEPASEANAPAAAHSDAQEPRDKAVAGFGAFRGNQAYGSFARVAIHLPSGLDAASVASANHRTLAIDSGGAVFARDDSGATWQRVVPRWTGRAVSVHSLATPDNTAVAAPNTSPPAQSAEAPPPGSPSVGLFELVNDKGMIWLSADGLTWSAK